MPSQGSNEPAILISVFAAQTNTLCTHGWKLEILNPPPPPPRVMPLTRSRGGNQTIWNIENVDVASKWVCLFFIFQEANGQMHRLVCAFACNMQTDHAFSYKNALLYSAIHKCHFKFWARIYSNNVIIWILFESILRQTYINWFSNFSTKTYVVAAVCHQCDGSYIIWAP